MTGVGPTSRVITGAMKVLREMSFALLVESGGIYLANGESVAGTPGAGCQLSLRSCLTSGTGLVQGIGCSAKVA